MGHWSVGSRPTLNDIACFALVARRQSFSGAAAELGLSQPAVSQAVARLERQLGLRLLVRTSRGATVTEAGQAVLARAESLLEQADAFSTEAARLAHRADGIRLAYAPIVGTFAATIARRLLRRKPAVEVTLVPATWQEATRRLEQANVAAALMNTPFPPGYASTARFTVPITHLAIGAGQRLATAAQVTVEQLLGVEVLVPRPLWNGMTALLPGPHRPRLVCVEDDLTAGCDMVAAGRGVLPVPRPLVESLRRRDLCFVPFDTGLHLRFGLTWSPSWLTSEVAALVQTTQEALRTR
jgi:LysR family hydrogen peroxide-inducible transcriptional activator